MNGYFQEFPDNLGEELRTAGYEPAEIYAQLAQEKYSRVVEICRGLDQDQQRLVSVRLAKARALFYSGQMEPADELFKGVLAEDPENLVALKYLGDIRFAAGDEVAAFSYYSRVLEIDPSTDRLSNKLGRSNRETTRTVTLARRPEGAGTGTAAASLRRIYFYTETVGDLYLAQGHNRMAAEVFRKLSAHDESPRIREKMKVALDRIKEKERR